MVTVAEAARLLSLSSTTVERLVADGSLPSVKIGRARRIPIADLESYVDTLPREHRQRQSYRPSEPIAADSFDLSDGTLRTS